MLPGGKALKIIDLLEISFYAFLSFKGYFVDQ